MAYEEMHPHIQKTETITEERTDMLIVIPFRLFSARGTKMMKVKKRFEFICYHEYKNYKKIVKSFEFICHKK